MDGEWEPPMIPNPEYKVGSLWNREFLLSLILCSYLFYYFSLKSNLKFIHSFTFCTRLFLSSWSSGSARPSLSSHWAKAWYTCMSLCSQTILCVLQGEWKPKQIDNPNYKGAWVHPEIDNPEYSPDSNIYKFDKIGVIGLDLWQVRKEESPLRKCLMLELQLNFSVSVPGQVWHHLWQLPHHWRCEGSRRHRKWDMGCDKGMSTLHFFFFFFGNAVI